MALIECENCGQTISDRASECPHCGWEVRNKERNVKFIIIGAIAAVLIFGGVGLYYKSISDEEKAADATAELAAQQQADEDARMALICDSIYSNFTSTDLNMLDAKGFIHTLEYKVIDNNCDQSPINEDFLFTFDRQGNIVDIKTKFCVPWVADDSEKPNELVDVSFDRNGNGQINQIRYGITYVCGDYCDYGIERNFKYDSKGRVNKISDDAVLSVANQAQIDYRTYEFSRFIEGEGYTKCKTEFNIRFKPGEGDFTVNKVEKDMLGNWISNTGSFDSQIDSFEGIEYNKSNISIVRTISYYAKDEIDFTPFLNNNL